MADIPHSNGTTDGGGYTKDELDRLTQAGEHLLWEDLDDEDRLGVVDCNGNGSGPQSARFLDHIICIYPPPQDRITCD